MQEKDEKVETVAAALRTGTLGKANDGLKKLFLLFYMQCDILSPQDTAAKYTLSFCKGKI